MKMKTGRRAVRKALSKGEEGANSLSSVWSWKQSNERRASELEPKRSAGRNMSVRELGKFMLYEIITVISCR